MSTALLLGIPAQLKTLVTRLSATWAAKVDTLATDWTTARAAKVDNLDTTMSSRAAAATALTNATWTDARASYLANLASGAPLTIKNRIAVSASIPSGSSSGTASLGVTITLAKSILIMNGNSANSSVASHADNSIHGVLNTTTIDFTRGGTAGTVNVRATVIEFY